MTVSRRSTRGPLETRPGRMAAQTSVRRGCSADSVAISRRATPGVFLRCEQTCESNTVECADSWGGSRGTASSKRSPTWHDAIPMVPVPDESLYAYWTMRRACIPVASRLDATSAQRPRTHRCASRCSRQRRLTAGQNPGRFPTVHRHSLLRVQKCVSRSCRCATPLFTASKLREHGTPQWQVVLGKGVDSYRSMFSTRCLRRYFARHADVTACASSSAVARAAGSCVRGSSPADARDGTSAPVVEPAAGE